MKWPWSGDNSTQQAEDTTTGPAIDKVNYTPGKKILFRDTEPRFNDNSNNANNTTTFKDAWSTISKDEFTMANLVGIPCFRDAGLVGFSSMILLATITSIFHRRASSKSLYYNKIINWSMAGLLFGSIIGWEQCRLKRRKSFQIAQLAIETVQRKEKPMMNQQQQHPTSPVTKELLKEWKEHPNDVTKSANNNPWYKFW